MDTPLLVAAMRRNPTGTVAHQPFDGPKTGTTTTGLLAELDAWRDDPSHPEPLLFKAMRRRPGIVRFQPDTGPAMGTTSRDLLAEAAQWAHRPTATD